MYLGILGNDMQIRVHKNVAHFATSPEYFGYVRVVVFLLLGRVFPGGTVINTQ